jgi:hypothetical protein
MTVIGVVFVGMWSHLVRQPHLTVESVTTAQLQRSLRLSYVSPVVYGVTIGLAFVSPYLCLAVYAALAIFFARGPSARALIAAQDVSEAKEPADDDAEWTGAPALADDGGPPPAT